MADETQELGKGLVNDLREVGRKDPATDQRKIPPLRNRFEVVPTTLDRYQVMHVRLGPDNAILGIGLYAEVTFHGSQYRTEDKANRMAQAMNELEERTETVK